MISSLESLRPCNSLYENTDTYSHPHHPCFWIPYPEPKWRGKSFFFEGAGLRIMVFQSAPPALDGPPHAPRPREEELEVEQAAGNEGAERAR